MMGKLTVDQIRNLPEPVDSLDGERHYFGGNYGGFFFGFLAARAMPDGALAVAMQFGDDYVQIMRLYIRQLDQEFNLSPDYDFLGISNRLRGWRQNEHKVKMDFHVGDVVHMSRKEYDERTFHQQIPQYREIGAMETKLIEASK